MARLLIIEDEAELLHAWVKGQKVCPESRIFTD